MSFVTPAQAFSEMLKIQLIAIAVLAAVLLVFVGVEASVSSVMGGISVVVGSFLASLMAKKKTDQTSGSAVLINLLKAEAVKIFTIIVLLFLVFKLYVDLVPFALIGGLAATALFSGVALSKLNV